MTMSSRATEPADTPGYRQALHRIRAEYLEMPGMRLTPEQVRRLSGVEASICDQVLEELVRAKFLRLGADGTFVRTSDDGPWQSPVSEPQAPMGRVRNAS
jgi:hypothetical protein